MKKILLSIFLVLFVFSYSYGKYDRDEFAHWSDFDHDGLDTRAETLLEESIVKVVIRNDHVVSGIWVCPYTGKIIFDSSSIDIDHIVPLSEAYKSGADKWDAHKKELFANDPENLTISYNRTNRKKSDKDPAHWMPPNRAYWETYLQRWIRVKQKYHLLMDKEEQNAIKVFLEESIKYRY